MSLTVITIKNVPKSLRGDLTKWMQEIATGVYVGNFNARIREKLWDRVKESVKGGEATLTYACRNEIGYSFDSINADREVVDLDGIPLIRLPSKDIKCDETRLGFSKVAKFRKAQKYSNRVSRNRSVRVGNDNTYVFIDIETDGLDEEQNSIIELGAYKINNLEAEEFNCMIEYKKKLPKTIKNLTGITDELLYDKGEPIDVALKKFLDFIGDDILVGYSVNFDIKFINKNLKKLGLPVLKNKTYDLMKYVKKDKMFLSNYKMQTVLREYGIEDKVPHRALLDAKLIYRLSTKVNKFSKALKKK